MKKPTKETYSGLSQPEKETYYHIKKPTKRSIQFSHNPQNRILPQPTKETYTHIGKKKSIHLYVGLFTKKCGVTLHTDIYT